MFNLDLVNFRSFNKDSFKFSPPTLITGPNAVGKTNILEAIFLAATTNSFRKIKNSQLIRQQASFSKIYLKTGPQELELRLIKERGRIKKEARIDQRMVKLAEFVGRFPAVIFSPESLHIIKGPPQGRRSLLNLVLSQADRHYLYALLNYQRVMRERNRLLFMFSEGRAGQDEFEFWDQRLVESGSRLVRDRAKVVKYFNRVIPGFYQEMAGQKRRPRLIYQTNVGQSLESVKELKKQYAETLRRSLPEDLKRLVTTKGPHRDELFFYFGKDKLPEIGSQGEIRSLAFALKLAEKKYLEKVNHGPINFLLDDPLSELDRDRSGSLLGLAQQEKAIATALPEELERFEKPEKHFQIINLENGQN